MEVLYVDNHLLVVNKPAGLLTQASGTKEPNTEDLARAWIKERFEKPGAVFGHVVHRLDRPVSGIVVIARTSKALTRLNEAMRSKKLQKIYYAIVCKTPKQTEGVLEHYLAHDAHHALVTSSNDPDAVLARLRYRVVETHAEGIVLQIELETGRYHQIRAQLAAIGCPILGDCKYGGKAWHGTEGIALHHGKLELTHPTSKETLTIISAIPNDWPIRFAIPSQASWSPS